VEYREGVFVGYRHYDSAGAEPLFPFGHGLSYARFEYGAALADEREIREGEPFRFSIDVKNPSSADGAETVQVYVRDLESSVPRPFQELKAFKKLFIAAGSQARAEFSLDDRAFSFWDEAAHGWKIESGDFEIRVGSSSRDIRSTFIASVRAKAEDKKIFGMNTRYFELKDSFAGRAFMAEIEPFLRMALSAYVPGSPEALMTEANQRETPLRNISRMSGGALPLSRIEKLIADMRAEEVAP
jgi:beta-glucosidase